MPSLCIYLSQLNLTWSTLCNVWSESSRNSTWHHTRLGKEVCHAVCERPSSCCNYAALSFEPFAILPLSNTKKIASKENWCPYLGADNCFASSSVAVDGELSEHRRGVKNCATPSEAKSLVCGWPPSSSTSWKYTHSKGTEAKVQYYHIIWLFLSNRK